MLSTLYQSGEFVCPRSSVELNKMLGNLLDDGVSYRMKGNMAFARAVRDISCPFVDGF